MWWVPSKEGTRVVKAVSIIDQPCPTMIKHCTLCHNQMPMLTFDRREESAKGWATASQWKVSWALYPHAQPITSVLPLTAPSPAPPTWWCKHKWITVIYSIWFSLGNTSHYGLQWFWEWKRPGVQGVPHLLLMDAGALGAGKLRTIHSLPIGYVRNFTVF